MKKLAAAVVALVMVVGAVLVRRGLDDHRKVAERVTVLCAQTIAPACEAWRDAGANVTVSAGRDLSTLKADDLSAYDLVVGPQVLVGSLLGSDAGGGTALATSPVVVVSRASAPACRTAVLACLLKRPLDNDTEVQRTGELGPDLQAALRRASGGDPAMDDLLGSSQVPAASSITLGKVANTGIPSAAVMVGAVVPKAETLLATAVPDAAVTIAGFARAGAPAAATRLLADPVLATSLQAAGWLAK